MWYHSLQVSNPQERKGVITMRKTWLVLLLALVTGAFLAGMGKRAVPESAPRMTKEELKPRLGAADLVVIDVRAPKDWDASGLRIAGAIRENTGEPEKWGRKYPREKTLVLYCA